MIKIEEIKQHELNESEIAYISSGERRMWKMETGERLVPLFLYTGHYAENNKTEQYIPVSDAIKIAERMQEFWNEIKTRMEFIQKEPRLEDQ